MGSNDYGRTPNVWQPSEVPNPNTGSDYGVGQAAQFGPTTTTTITEFGYPPGGGWTTLRRLTNTISKNPFGTGVTPVVFDTIPLNSKRYSEYRIITSWSVTPATTTNLTWALRPSPKIYATNADASLTGPQSFVAPTQRRGQLVALLYNVHVAGSDKSDINKIVQFGGISHGWLQAGLAAGDEWTTGAGFGSPIFFGEENLPLETSLPISSFANLMNTPGEHDLEMIVTPSAGNDISITRTLFWLLAR